MSDPSPTAKAMGHPRQSLHRAGLYAWLILRWIGRFARYIVPRVYAVGLIILITWLTYLAIRYLVTSLTLPGHPPPQITALPTRMDRAALGMGRSAFQALDAAEHPRSPLAHYHRLDSWIQPDSFNDCARSGCHNPLPHAKKKEVRAFLNMHATSIHCGVCHFQSEQRPRPLAWYDRKTGRTCETPAILQAYALIAGPDVQTQWKKADIAELQRLVGLLRRASEEAGGVASLDQLADHFDAYRLGSAGFMAVLDDARDVLPRHFRGEYGGKLALLEPTTGAPVRGLPNTEAAVRAWFARKDAASPDERTRLLNDVHPQRRQAALTCTDCHTAQGSLVDFAQLGYPPARVEQLVSPIAFRMIEHINAGRPFNLQTVIDGPTPLRKQETGN